jgi:hypothetical protein
MNITPDEARAALDDIRRVTAKTRELQNSWAHYMILWGTLWTIGFLASQFFPPWINWIWIVLIVIGMAGSYIITHVNAQHMRLTPGSQAASNNAKIGISCGVLYGFTILWLVVFQFNSAQTGVLWITVVMFIFIIFGIWYQMPSSIVVGVGITVMSLLGYYLLPNYFFLWVAVFAGLPLIIEGLYILRKR